MADPRRASTRRAVLSYDQLKQLINWPDLLVKDYQGIIQDFAFTADEIDALEIIVLENKEDIEELQEAVQDLQERVDALEYKVFSFVEATTSITTGPFEIIDCSNASKIEVTLDPDALDLDEVHIARSNARVDIVGTVNGKTNITLNVKGFSVHLIKNPTGWLQI